MREASRVSTFYIFIAILGGIYSFGMLGIFYGPLILSFVMVMLQIYLEEYADDLDDHEEAAQ
jgi:predicted PurR-regulated permease PerM